MLKQLQSLSHEFRSRHDVQRHVSQPYDIFENAKGSIGEISTLECLTLVVAESRLWSRTYTIEYWYDTISPITQNVGLGLSSVTPLAHVFVLE